MTFVKNKPADAPFVVDPGANLGLVYFAVGKFMYPNEDHDELIGVGTDALIRASQLFNPDAGVRFSSYATRAIFNAVLHHRRDHKKHRVVRPLSETRQRLTAAREAQNDFIDAVEHEDHQARCRAIGEAVGERAMEVLMRRSRGENFATIARSLHISKERVRQIEREAIRVARELEGVPDDGRTICKGPHLRTVAKPDRRRRGPAFAAA